MTSLKREVENVRIARFTTHSTGLVCRILISMVHQSLQRASSGIANMTNKQHFFSIDYMKHKDANMEGFLDKVMRRINLCDGLNEEDIEATFQKQVARSQQVGCSILRISQTTRRRAEIRVVSWYVPCRM